MDNDGDLFGLWLCFGTVAGFFKPALSPKLKKTSLRSGYNIFLKRFS
jgi:hypothetical protein